jgi:hypothetical protein
MVNELIKKQVVGLVEAEKLRLGSYNKVAEKCNISGGMISHIRNRKDINVSDETWLMVGASLGLDLGSKWQVVDIASLQLLRRTLITAKENRLFMAVSDLAGIGKTTGNKNFAQEHLKNGVFLIECREWGKREFLLNLARSLGIATAKNYMSLDEMLMSIVEFFYTRSMQKPLLIIDEADKLKPAALRSVITMYNECDGIMGMVISGTENLKQEIKRGVRFNRKGYDEIDSRFGRNYIKLLGASLNDVTAICKANGVMDKAIIEAIFLDSGPVRELVGERELKVVKDLRRVKRAVQREVLKSALNVAAASS